MFVTRTTLARGALDDRALPHLAPEAHSFRLDTRHVGHATDEQSLDAIAGDLDDLNPPTAHYHDFADERDTLDVVEDESCQGNERVSAGEPLGTDGAL